MTNKDVHVERAMVLFGVREDQVTPEMRRMGKVANMAMAYGWTGTKEDLGRIMERDLRLMDTSPKLEEAMEAFRAPAFAGLPKTVDWAWKPVQNPYNATDALALLHEFKVEAYLLSQDMNPGERDEVFNILIKGRYYLRLRGLTFTLQSNDEHFKPYGSNQFINILRKLLDL